VDYVWADTVMGSVSDEETVRTVVIEMSESERRRDPAEGKGGVGIFWVQG